MITPSFNLSQTENQIIITINAPYTNVKDTEIHVEDDDVRFFSAPYYLLLTLPGKVTETDNSSAKYVSDDSNFVITLDKVTPGQHFPNLDMISTLLKHKENKKVMKPFIEVMEDSTTLPSCSTAVEEMDMGGEQWHIEQTVTSNDFVLPGQHCYGFGNSHKGLGTKYEVELGEVAEIKNPDCTSLEDRINEKKRLEKEKFNDDHYLSDLMFGDDIPRLLEFQLDTDSLRQLTHKNLEVMKNLRNRDFLMDKLELKQAFLGLIDIMFAYCYDWRTTEGSHTIESAWNLSRLSGTLSWFMRFSNVKEVVVSSMRRSLSYPLCRNWELSWKVFQDTISILRTGPTGILVCLLDIYKLFNARDPYYLLNQLYIEDYCVWVQKLQPESLSTLITALQKTVGEISKGDMGFDLIELEIAAKLVDEEEMEEDLSSTIGKINI